MHVSIFTESDVPALQGRCFLSWSRSHAQVMSVLSVFYPKLFADLKIELIHFRDLKPHNLLMDLKTMKLKIADLGLSRAFTIPIKKYTHEVNSTS